jgi:hypothetical protein
MVQSVEERCDMLIALTKRIRTLIDTAGLNCDECHETIMSAKNPPPEEEFRLAYSAAVMLSTPSPNGGMVDYINRQEPIPEPEIVCTSCDDQGCGFCVTGDSLAAWFPRE